MHLEMILFIGGVVFGLTSCIIFIVNALRVSSVSLLLTELERSLDAKSTQLDILQKEWQQRASSQEESQPPVERFEEDKGEIHIVRNLRKTYQSNEAQSLEPSPVPIHETQPQPNELPVEEVRQYTPISAENTQTLDNPFIQTEHSTSVQSEASLSQFAQPEYVNSAEENIENVYIQQGDTAQLQSTPSTPLENDDVMDIVNESDTPVDQSSDRSTQPATPSLPDVKIQLFNASRKDADFANAWQQIKLCIDTSGPVRIVLDFQGILFLYPKELSFLEKFQTYVVEHSGQLTFTHYQDELKYIIKSNPVLSTCLS